MGFIVYLQNVKKKAESFMKKRLKRGEFPTHESRFLTHETLFSGTQNPLFRHMKFEFCHTKPCFLTHESRFLAHETLFLTHESPTFRHTKLEFWHTKLIFCHCECNEAICSPTCGVLTDCHATLAMTVCVVNLQIFYAFFKEPLFFRMTFFRSLA